MQPIEEIIGLEGGEKATANHLSDWLNQNDGWPDPYDPLTITWDEDTRQYTVSGYMIPDGLVTEVGPGILEALEAAVRKVDAEC